MIGIDENSDRGVTTGAYLDGFIDSLVLGFP